MDLTRILEGANGDIIVLSRSEGAWLGVLSGAQFEPETGGLAAILYRRNGGRFVVAKEAVEVLGQDAFLVRSRGDVREVAEGDALPGRALRALRDVPVTTHTGERLGLLYDVRFDRESGRLTTILLDDARALDVAPDEITVGRDEILVPAEYSIRVREARSGELGLLERMSTGSTLGDVVTGVRRIVSKSGRARASALAAAASN